MSTPVAERSVQVTDPLGLHARPAARFAEHAGRHPCEVVLEKDGCAVDAKSVLSVLTLDVRRGDLVTVRAIGAGAQQAVDELTGLIAGP
jgi:phosphocarrier protein